MKRQWVEIYDLKYNDPYNIVYRSYDHLVDINLTFQKFDCEFTLLDFMNRNFIDSFLEQRKENITQHIRSFCQCLLILSCTMILCLMSSLYQGWSFSDFKIELYKEIELIKSEWRNILVVFLLFTIICMILLAFVHTYCAIINMFYQTCKFISRKIINRFF